MDPMKQWDFTKQLWRSRSLANRQRAKATLLQDLRLGRRPKVAHQCPATFLSQGTFSEVKQPWRYITLSGLAFAIIMPPCTSFHLLGTERAM
eukprot:1969759-Amphidinium_carterae.2